MTPNRIPNNIGGGRQARALYAAGVVNPFIPVDRRWDRPVDGAFGLSTNVDPGSGANADIEGDTDRRGNTWADAARKFSANEANAAEQGVGAQEWRRWRQASASAQRRARRRHGAADPAPATGDGQGAMQPLMAYATGPRR